jgi:hypothetical protein
MGPKIKDKKSTSRPSKAKLKTKDTPAPQQKGKKGLKPRQFVRPPVYTKALAEYFNDRYMPSSSYPEIDFLEFQNELRKLTKKSDVTKLKALQDILNRIGEASDMTLFVDLMPTWVRLFC